VTYIRDAQLLEPEIAGKIAAGFRAFKLKVGDDAKLDLERIRTLRRITKQEAYVKADASGAWEFAEAAELLREMAEAGVNTNTVETPLRSASRNLAKNHPESVNRNTNDVAAARAIWPVAPVPVVSMFSSAPPSSSASACWLSMSSPLSLATQAASSPCHWDQASASHSTPENSRP